MHEGKGAPVATRSTCIGMGMGSMPRMQISECQKRHTYEAQSHDGAAVLCPYPSFAAAKTLVLVLLVELWPATGTAVCF